MFCKKGVLRNFTNFQENTCARVSSLTKLQVWVWPEACNFIKKNTLAHVFFCEFCEISKNIFSYRTPPVAASSLLNYMPYVPSRLRALIFTRLNYAPCSPYLSVICTYSEQSLFIFLVKYFFCNGSCSRVHNFGRRKSPFWLDLPYICE